MSFQKVRDSLIYCLADKVIDYEELFYCTMHINQRMVPIRTGDMKIFVSIH